MSGKVFLVGAGPGAPDLLTLRAAEILQRANVVLHDALVHPQTLAMARQAIRIDVGKRAGRHATAQRFICRRLVESARKHAIVVRLKGGDPMLFGRAREEIDALVEAGIDFEVIPGVTAAFGASARLGVSLTERSVSRSVALVTPRFGDGECAHDWVRAAVAADTAVIYMARSQAGAVLCGLRSGGMRDMTPVALVENATWETEFVRYGRLYELPALASQLGPGPALIITGEVLRTAVSLEQRARAVRRVAASAMPTGAGYGS